MMFFKTCPKCHGDMYVDRDVYGTFIECLQCGLLRDVESSHVPNADSIPHVLGELLSGQSPAFGGRLSA